MNFFHVGRLNSPKNKLLSLHGKQNIGSHNFPHYCAQDFHTLDRATPFLLKKHRHFTYHCVAIFCSFVLNHGSIQITIRKKKINLISKIFLTINIIDNVYKIFSQQIAVEGV
jgi:hypothetical protein